MKGFIWTYLLEVPQSLTKLKFHKLIALYNRQYTSYIMVENPDREYVDISDQSHSASQVIK